MDAKTYFKVTTINLTFLAIGAMLGPLIVHTDRVVYAQVSSGVIKSGVISGGGAPAAQPPECQNAECITPREAIPSAAIGILLANRAAFDSLTVNGYDLLKLDDVTLSTLQEKGILTANDVREIISRAKAEKPLRARPQGQ